MAPLGSRYAYVEFKSISVQVLVGQRKGLLSMFSERSYQKPLEIFHEICLLKKRKIEMVIQ